jgi:hypothetical protein
LYDWVALLWAAFGEFPARNLLANVNYRRALPFISDYRNLFGTRVSFETVRAGGRGGVDRSSES